MREQPIFRPRDYQNQIVDWIMEKPKCAIWAGMGLGKTAATIQALSFLGTLEPVFPVLVVAPLRVARSTWLDELSKWSQFSYLRASFLGGTPDERLKVLANADNIDIFTTNYEQLPWLWDTLGVNGWMFNTLVIDEATRLKSYRGRGGSIRARALAKAVWAKKQRVVELSGTPAPNGLVDLWGQMWFVDNGKRLGETYTAYERKWFDLNKRTFRVTPRENAQKEIEEAVSDVCLALRAEDHFSLEEPIHNRIALKLPEDVHKKYKEVETQLFTLLADGTEISAASTGVAIQKCMQIANGSIYLNTQVEYDEEGEFLPREAVGSFSELHDIKLDALEEIVEEACGAPVLVSYTFRADLVRLLKRFPQGRRLDTNPQTIRDWNAGKIPVLFAHPASAGHGLNLQDGGNILVFFSADFNLEHHLQIIERIGPVRQKQAGHKRPVFIHRLIMTGTIEEVIEERLLTKRSTQDLLMAAVRKGMSRPEVA